MIVKKPVKKRIIKRPIVRRICFETIEEAKPFLEKLLNGDEVLAGQVVRIQKEEITAQMVCFVKEYVKDFNATQAALRAKYTANTVHGTLGKIMAKIGVSSMIQIETKKYIERNHIEKDRIVKEWKNIGFSNPRDLMMWGAKGLVVKSSKEITDDQAASIKEIYTDKHGFVRFKFHDKSQALEGLAKSIKIIDYEKKVDLGNADDKPFKTTIEDAKTYEEAAQMFLEKTVKGKE
jgi:hypothetical protein